MACAVSIRNVMFTFCLDDVLVNRIPESDVWFKSSVVPFIWKLFILGFIEAPPELSALFTLGDNTQA